MSFNSPDIFQKCLSKQMARVSLVFLTVFTHWQALAETTGVAQTTRTKPSVVGSDNVISVVFSLLFVVAVIFMLAWVMRRMGAASMKPNSLLKTVSSLSIGQRERIVLVQLGEQQLLLGVAPGRVETLHVLESPLEVNQGDSSISGSFADRLKSIVNKEK
jgi:flagellar protein FliO/FliZ